MKTKTTLAITIIYRRPEEIEEVQRLSKEAKGFKQAAIYLAGLYAITDMIKKSKPFSR